MDSKVTMKKDEEKAIHDARVVAENAPDAKTKDEATSTLSAANKPAPVVKPPVKAYTLESLKKNPFEAVGITATDAKPITKEETEKQRKAEFDKLPEDEKKKFIIKAKLLENRWLDKKDQHEVSLEDEKFAGVTL